MAAKNKSNELKIVRLYDAPVKLVWDAWTDPKQVAKWWGPRGFTITTHSKDLRAGGHWSYTMHGPDGVDYPNNTKYFEVEKYSKLVYDYGGNEDQPPIFRVTVFFTELNGKTKLEMTMALPTPEALDETRKIIKKAHGNSTWDRLGEFLMKETSDKEVFIINHTFDAPIDLMYEMWTNPKHLSQWLPPTGMQMQFIKSDIKPGGRTFYMMSNGKDIKMYGRAMYLELVRPNRVVYTQEFCDEKENVTRHYMMPTFPETMLTTIILAEEGPNKTRVTVTWEAHGHVTCDELETFVKARGGMTQGWSGSFDKLEEYIAKSV